MVSCIQKTPIIILSALWIFGGCQSSPTLPPDTVHSAAILKTDITEKNFSLAIATDDSLKLRIGTMLGAKIIDSDEQILQSFSKLITAFELLKEKRWSDSQKMAREILQTQNLSSQIYRWALSAYGIAYSVSLDQKEPSAASTRFVVSKTQDFNQFQLSLCDELCDSEGWKTIAAEDEDALKISGFSKRILSTIQFDLAKIARPNFLGALFGENKEVKKELSSEESNIPALIRLKKLMNANKINEALKIAKTISKVSLGNCDATYLYAQHIIAQSQRFAQNRSAFYNSQKALIDSLITQKCNASLFAMDEKTFDSFFINAQIWLARLHWENGFNDDALKVAQSAFNAAEKKEIWDLYLEAGQVLVGRVGFESLKPAENIALLSRMEKFISEAQGNEFKFWVFSRKGLYLLLDKRPSEAAKLFDTLETMQPEDSEKAFAQFWHAQALKELNQERLADNKLLATGISEPLGIYDIWSGRQLGMPSGRVSSAKSSPFAEGWAHENAKWLNLKADSAFRIFRPSTWFAQQKEAPAPTASAILKTQFDISLQSAILLATAIHAQGQFKIFDDYTTYLRDSGSLMTLVLKSEVNWLRTRFLAMSKNRDFNLVGHEKIAWLLHANGDYVNAIPFVGALRDRVQFEDDVSSFLYFIFYPRPYFKEISEAAKQCDVELNLLFAVARQESLFQPKVKSGVGAIGLFQLMPNTGKKVLRGRGFIDNKQEPDLTNPTINARAGACYLSDLLKRYSGNKTYAVAAYNAGEFIVDKWIARRDKYKNNKMFIEFIPYAETKKYVMRVERNFENLNWIYSDAAAASR